MNEDFSTINGEGTYLRNVQLRLLDIFIEVEKILRKHNIEYWLIGGTLLGAVRHGGFIPWDYDIDVSVLYKDIKKLRKVLNEELPEQFVVQDYSTDKKYFIESVFKVRDKKSFFPYESHSSFKEQGLFIDFIPMEKLPSMRLKRFVFNFNKNPYLRHKEMSLQGKTKNFKGLLMAPFSYILKNFAHWYSDVSKTNQFGYNYLFWLGPCFEMRFNMNVIYPLKTLEFEGIQFYVPNDTHQYLKLAYGDYMQLPPVDKREIFFTEIKVYDKLK